MTSVLSRYLALQIRKGQADYIVVIDRYPQYKNEVDEILVSEGYEHLIVTK